MLSWRPWTSCILSQGAFRQGVFQFQGVNLPETKSKIVYAKAGLTLRAEFAEQPSLLFVPNEPVSEAFVLYLRAGWPSQESLPYIL